LSLLQQPTFSRTPRQSKAVTPAGAIAPTSFAVEIEIIMGSLASREAFRSVSATHGLNATHESKSAGEIGRAHKKTKTLPDFLRECSNCCN
jgi:hypothetical protein